MPRYCPVGTRRLQLFAPVEDHGTGTRWASSASQFWTTTSWPEVEVSSVAGLIIRKH